MLVALIVACEIAFWIVLAAGLLARYAWRRERLSTALLVAVPLIDLVLLAATVADLAGGATAGFSHGLAAAYLGFSVAFGPSLVRWADVRVAHRFADGPAPVKPPKGGVERTRYEWREFGKAALAWGIACGLLGLAIAVVGDADRTEALLGWIGRLTLVLAIWSIWPLSHSFATIGRCTAG